MNARQPDTSWQRRRLASRRAWWSPLAILVLVCAAYLAPNEAWAHHGTKWKLCVRVEAIVSDTTGQPDEIGTTGNWIARGMRVAVKRDDEAHSHFYWLGQDDGCVWVYNDYGHSYKVWIYSYGRPNGGNTVYVRNDQGNYAVYLAGNIWISNTQSGPWYVTVTGYKLPGKYAQFAYAMRHRFLGSMSNEDLNVYWENPNTCCGFQDCSCDGGAIYLSNNRWWYKFVSMHEYGHVNLLFTAGSYKDDCSFNGAGHEMTGPEYASCAAMEGWAHFVSADIWNNTGHSGYSNPTAWFRYSGDLINVEAGGSSCSNYAHRYRASCTSGTAASAGHGVELDWMRAWWDYHTNNTGSTSGSPPSHAYMQEDIEASLPWSKTSTCNDLLDGIEAHGGFFNQAMDERFQEMADWNSIDLACITQ